MFISMALLNSCKILSQVFMFSLIAVKLSRGTLFATNPKIEVKNGHLTIQSPRDKNLTLVVSGSGQLNLLGDPGFLSSGGNDLGTSGNLEPRIARLETSWDDGALFNTRLQAMEERMQRLETNRGQEDQESSSTTIRKLKRDIRQIKRKLSVIVRMINNNECNDANPCQNGGTCVDTFRGYFCQCPDNWEGQNCERDVDECSHFANTDLGCQNGATCQNIAGSYRCHCPPDFFGIHCTRKQNDCTSGSSQELCGHGVCVNQDSGFTCICDQGWTSEESSPACSVDVDECTAFNPPCSKSPLVACINTPGGFQCGACPAGYTGNGFYCDDINECFTNNGGCSSTPRVDCINTPGSRTCGSCPQGYQGNGQTCVYMGPCHVNNGGCSPMAVCFATANMVQCFCRPGYQGLGVGPTGCLPGSDGNVPGPVVPPGGGSGGVVMSPCASGPCRNGATCFPLATNFICQCSPGYSGLTCNEEIDECISQPCYNGGTCIDQHNGFVCQCTADFQGTNCQDQVQSCGGSFTGDLGTIDFPHGETTVYDHDMSCIYTITVSNSKVLNITFTQFNLEESATCSYDFLQIRDGPDSTSQPMGKFCGSTLPGQNGTLITNQNAVHMWFKSDSSFAHHGFQLMWNVTDPVCGGIIRDQTHGTIKSPGYPGQYPHNRDCFWTIYAPYGKRIQFHFAHLAIETHANCSYDYLEVYDGTHHTPTQASLGRYCNSTSPPPVSSSNSIATIHFHSDGSLTDDGFQISWAAVPGIPGCGALLTEPEAEFSSPSHPQTYSHNLNCEWLIRVPIGDTIELSFFSLDIESHANCRYDFLEVRDGSTPDSPLVGRYCGTTRPPSYVSTSNTLFIHFKTDQSITGIGFRAKYKTVCGGEFTNPTGIISSPYHPNNYPGNRICQYVISQPVETSIHIEFIDFDIEGSFQCVYDYLEIRDGDNANSTLLGKYCGDPTQIPDPVDSTHNFVYLRFQTDGSVQNRGFRLNYTTTDLRCGGILKATHGVIQSPTDAENYPHGTTCKWIIQGEANTIIRLTWVSFILERHSRCQFDYVDVFDNNTQNNAGGLIGRYCGNTLPPTMTSTGSSMSVVFQSDASISHEGFVATYLKLDSSTICGGTYYTLTGMLQSPNFPNGYGHLLDCTWVIQGPSGRQIMLNFTTFHLENHTNCNYDSLEIRNGGHSTSPLIGRFCGNQIPSRIPSFSNSIYLRMRTDNSLSAEGFQMYWDSTSSGCGGLLTSPTGSITSPGYPTAYYHNAECLWEIRVSKGSKVQIIFVDLDLERHRTCRHDYVEVVDIPSRNPLGKFCHMEDHINVVSSGNDVKIKFRADRDTAGRGFHLRYFTICNNELVGHQGVIESPNFPNPYPHNRNCTWQITAPLGNTVNLTFSHFELENSHPRNGTCVYDFLEILEANVAQGDQTSVIRICGSEPGRVPAPVATSKRYAFVKFKSDVSLSMNGFRLEYVINGCGEHFRRPFGSFTSPNYPEAYPVSVECVWYITTDPGTSIELTVDEFDMENHPECGFDYLTVYGGPDDTSPQLTKLCQSSVRNVTVTASGNHMMIHFRSDSSIAARGFSARFRSKPDGCGGLITVNEGVITSPNYPDMYDNYDDCLWLIQVDPLHRLELEFTDFDVEPHSNCSYDYVAIYNGDTESAPNLLTHCGRSLPPINPVFSTANQMLIRLKADGSSAAKGFKAQFKRACGATILTSGRGDIASPDFPHAWGGPGSCSWIIKGTHESDRVTLHWSYLQIMGRNPDGNCTNTYVAVYDGQTDDAPEMTRVCSSHSPPPITSTGNSMHVVVFSRHRSPIGSVAFRGTYTTEDTACGGDLESVSGRFTSPMFPGSYINGVECTWIIGGYPGNRISLGFSQFDLEASPNCNNDYVEIHEEGPNGPLLGHYCGSTVPRNITHGEKLWVKFRSNEEDTGNGFVAFYSLEYGNHLTGSEGEIVSPLFPRKMAWTDVNDPNEIVWTITVDQAKNVRISFTSFDVTPNGYRSGGCLTTVTIFDGPDQGAPSLYSGCGFHPPEPFESNGNVVVVRFKFLVRRSGGSKFRLLWNEVSRGAIPHRRLSPSLGNPDTNIIRLTHNSTTTLISSPGYPNSYPNNLHKEWIVESPIGTKMKVQVLLMALESSWLCRNDFLEIYDGSFGSRQWNRTGKICRRYDQRKVYYSSGNVLKLRFVTDSSGSRRGFRVLVKTVCGGYLQGDYGFVTSPNYGEGNYSPNLDCEWVIRVRPGRKIEFQLINMDIVSNDNQCPKDYLMIRNGQSDDSPLLLLNSAQGSDQNGRLCGSSLPSPRNSSSNFLYVKFHSDTTGSGAGFKLTYRELGFNCGGQVHLSPDRPEMIFTSPNYPHMPPLHTECIWTIMSPPGQKIQVEFLDNFYFTPSLGCSIEGVELRDGGTPHSTSLGRFCNERPNLIKSSDNIVWFKYFTNSDSPNLGFKAHAKIGSCGGTIYIRRNDEVQIESPEYPQPYAPNLDCEWKVFGPEGHFLIFSFVILDLPVASNCSNFDYVRVHEENNSTHTNLATLCGARPSVVETYGSMASLIFHSNGNNNNRAKTGFIVRVNASTEECGGVLQGDSGVIESPGYPNGYAHHLYCSWTIKAPMGRSVSLRFEDLDLERPRANECPFDKLLFYNAAEVQGKYESTQITGGTLCGNQAPTNISSSGNVMVVKFITDGSVAHRGFKLLWNSDEPSRCGGVVGPYSGPISPFLVGTNYTRSTICHWIYSTSTAWQAAQSEGGGTIVFQAERILLETKLENKCVFDNLNIVWENGQIDLCGQITTPTTVLVPWPMADIVFVSDGSVTDRGFNLTHSVSNCGGVFSGPLQRIQSPQDPNHSSNYRANANCVWLLEFDQGQQIALAFDRLDLESSESCNHDYILIRNGPSQDSPLIWKKCGTDSPQRNVISSSHTLWVEFHSDGSNQGTGFSFTASAHTLGCGGVFHGSNGNISAPMVGTKYANGVECLWDVEMQPGFHVVYQFFNRFEIATSTACSNDYIQIFEYNEENQSWIPKSERMCGRELPSPIVTNSTRTRVKFRSDQTENGDGFQLSWREECGGTFNTSNGIFSSPGYPVAYKTNLSCEYHILSDPAHFVSLTFLDPFEIGEDYGGGCFYDSVKVYSTSRSRNIQLGSYCGSEKPPPVRARGPVLVKFRTDGFGFMRGFQVEFTRHQCGGEIRDESVITSPLHPDRYFHNTNCTWFIEAPLGKSVIIKFDYLELEHHSRCRYDYVGVYEGHSLNRTNQLGLFCGNHSQMAPVSKSISNKMTVQFKTDRSNSARGFRAYIRFTYGVEQGCGGQMRVSEGGNGVQIRSLDTNSDGLYEMDLNCDWSFQGPSGKVLRMTFQQFDIEQEVNGTDITCWDYLEVRDGISPQSPLVGVYCGSSPVPSPITSSTNQLRVKFYSDSTGSESGFLAKIQAVDPVCGTHNIINVSAVNQVLYSPQFPANYPNSLRCQWVLAAPPNEQIWIKLTDFDLERSELCSRDYLSLADIRSRNTVQSNETVIAIPFQNRYRWARRTTSQDLTFCGNEIPHEFFSTGEMVKIQFVSDSQNTGRGFRLEHSIASCNRSYGGSYGRILSPGYPSRVGAGTTCDLVINAPSGSTIALYFSVFRLTYSPNCTRNSLEIRDGAHPTDRVISRMCGYSTVPTIVSSGPSLRLKLKVGSSYGTSGYDITYTTTNQGPGCGGLIFDSQGSVTSQGFPGNHSQVSDCTWTLRVPHGEIIELRFPVLQFGTTETCAGNYMELYNKPFDGPRQLVTRYCGNDRASSQLGISNEMQIRYVTDSQNSGGWKAQFKCLDVQGRRGRSAP